MIWSGTLTLFGIASFALIPKHPVLGYTIMLIDEILWTIYAIESDQYLFICSALLYAAVAIGHLMGENSKNTRRPAGSNPPKNNTKPGGHVPTNDRDTRRPPKK